jgi:hypothetical protein
MILSGMEIIARRLMLYHDQGLMVLLLKPSLRGTVGKATPLLHSFELQLSFCYESSSLVYHCCYKRAVTDPGFLWAFKIEISLL